MPSPETTNDDAPDDVPPDPDRAWARRLHELTGEVELIISGGMLLALAQAPEHLDAWWDSLRPHLTNPYYTVVFVGWYYLKLMVYTLVGAFGVHIFARAYWVGLLGLDSVFPHGIRWERIRYGPIAKRTYREAFRPLATLARRADHFGSTIFSFAFWIVLLFLVSTTIAATAGVGAVILHRWVLRSVTVSALWWALLGAFVMAPTVATLVDRLAGERLDTGGRLARAIRGALRGSYFVFGGPLLLPIQFTLTSNLRRGAMQGMMIGVFAVLVGIFLAGEVARSGDFVISASEAFPARPGPAAASGRYYEDASPDAVSRGLPSIQSDVVEGPYVRLRLPFLARRDADRLNEQCPELPALSRRGPLRTSLRDAPPEPAQERAVIACMAAQWTVRLDGAPVSPEWVLDMPSGAGIEGLVTYLSTDALAPGTHLLEVSEVPPGPGNGRADDEEGEDPRLRRHFIRFWI